MSASREPATGRDLEVPLRGVTADLLRRYDRPGPRYTSYPTAVEFADLEPGIYDELLGAADVADAPLSLYVHLPFCEEQCLFCACHVVITSRYDRALGYLDQVGREAEMVAQRLPHRRRVAQLHLGGGTPTYYRPDDLAAFLDRLLALFEPTADAELAVEVDPRVTSGEHLEVLAARGFNRLSMGVQDFAADVQEQIHRVQSVEEVERLLQQARACGFRGLNVDLVYGLPLQRPDSFARTVDTVIDLGFDRAAVYSFAYVPWMKGHQRKLDEASLPEAEIKFELFALARERFLEAGFLPIGMDHFARDDDELARALCDRRLRRNFQGYTVIPAPDVIGLGVSAIGDVRGAYIQNEKKLSRYEQRLAADELPVVRGIRRNRDDEIRRHLIHELMCNFRVDRRAVEERFEIDFADYFADDLRRLRVHVEEGMVEIDEDVVRATPLGQLFVRNLAMCFDRYWREKHERGAAPVFSRTV